MKSISNLTSPAVVGVVREKTAIKAIAEIKNCTYGGADIIDLHMSCLKSKENAELERIFSATKLPVIALNYNVDTEWKSCGFSEEEREKLFFCAIDCGASAIDMQGYTFDLKSKEGFYGEDKYSFTKGNPKEIVTDDKIIKKQCEFIEKVHKKGAEVLLSCHPSIPMNAEQVVELALFLEKRNPDVIKIVTIANDDDDLIEGFRAMKMLKNEVKTKVSYHVGGKQGALSRIINPILGGHLIFCVDRYSDTSTMEQLDLKTVKTIIDNVKKI